MDMEDLAMKLTRLSLPSAADALALIQSELSSLPSLDLSSLPPEETALFLVDLIEGFAREGPLSSPRVEALLSPAAALLRQCRSQGIACVAFADTHTPDSLELHSYPPHCLRGSREAEICRELSEVGGYTLIPKDSTNGFVEPAFEKWREAHPSIRRYLVVGDCTDICVSQFALTAKAWHNTRRIPLQVMVPLSLVDTYDGGAHQADLMNLTALYSMYGGGVELYSHIVDVNGEAL